MSTLTAASQEQAAPSVRWGGLLRWDPLAGTPSFTIVSIASA
ncbi:MAG TPA: hypothetical protein VMU47_12640 [Caldimonas sp.]|nr:hypothetical protein [Caldimonas sp.]